MEIKNWKLKINKLFKKITFVIVAILVVGAPMLYLILLNANTAKAAWYNDNWAYRQAVTATISSSSSDITSLQTLLTVNTSTPISAGKLQSNCADLRFTNVSGNLLPYYIDPTPGCNSSTTKIWVLADLVPKNTTTYTMYMYYGNPSAAAVSNAQPYFDNVVGLAGYWTLNDGSGSTAINSSATGSAINASFAGSPTPSWQTSSCEFNNCLSFNGTSAYTSIPNNSALNITGSFTIEAWVKRSSSTASSYGILGKGQGAGGTTTLDYVLFLDGSNKLQLRVSPNGSTIASIQSTNTYSDTTTWHHMVGVYTSVGNGTSLLDLYVDGSKAATEVTNAPSPLFTNSLIGTIGTATDNNGNPVWDLPGSIDDVKLYNNARTAQQISNDYNNILPNSNPINIATAPAGTAVPSTSFASEETTPGPIGWWKFDEGYGSTTSDSTQGGNTATLTGSSTSTGTGADGAITISSNTNINTANSITGRSCADGGDAVNYSVTASTSSGQNQITLSSTPSSGCLSANDEVLIINLQGTSGNNANVGQYETKIIQSISSATLTLTSNLTNSYDGTTQKIMVQRIPNYTNVTINGSTTLTAAAWNGTKGGVLAFRASGTVTVTGTISASSLGYNGGAEIENCASNYGNPGESYLGPATSRSNSANGGGGGGGQVENCPNNNFWSSGGGGGGYSAAGTGGGAGNGGSAATAGGGSYGSASLTTLYLGSGGGSSSANGSGANGSAGGGIIIIGANTLTVTGSIPNGSASTASCNSGSGSGGSTLISGNTVTLGSSLVTASAGSAGGQCGFAQRGAGGAGAAGRIVVNAVTLSGTTSPSATTGTIATPTWQTEDQCIAGKCLYFNGSSAKVTASNTEYSTQSVSFWVKPTSLSGTVPFVQLTSSAYIYASGTTLTSSGITSPTYYVNGIAGATTLTANQWNYVTVTTSSGITANAIVFGNQSTNYLNGFMDQIKFYNYVRSASQVLTGYHSEGVTGSSVNLGNSQLNNPSALNNGLVGYWKVDESSGSPADSSGNGYTGTTNGSPTVVTGKFDNALQFSGSNYVSTSESWPSSGSIALWAYPTSYSNWIGPAGWKHQSSGDGYVLIDEGGSGGTGNWRAVFRPGSTNEANIQSSSAITQNTWSHVVMTWSLSGTTYSIKLYVNGVSQGSTTWTGTSDTTGSFNFGTTGDAGNSSGNDFVGKVDEIRTYNRALSATDVTNLYNFAPGPVGYWKFDENTGSSVNDSSGNSNTGSWNGTLGSQWTTGKYGSAGNFDGSTNYISFANAISNIQTVTFWVYPASTSQYFLDLDGGTHYISASSGTVSATNFSSPTIYVNGVINGSVTAKTWNHIAVTTGTSFNSSSSMTFGKANGSNYLNGKLDDVQIYNYAQTQKQVIQDMNGSDPAPSGSSLSGNAAPLGYWKFNEGYGTTTNNSGSQGSSLNGTTSNTTWTNSGKSGKALSFNGSSSVVSTSNFTPFYTGGNVSFTAWVNPTAFQGPNGDYTGILTYGKSGNVIYDLSLKTDGTKNEQPIFEVQNSGGSYQNATAGTLITGTWYHLAGVLSGSNIYLYINGVQVASNTFSGTPANGDSSFTFAVGRDYFNNDSQRFFNGIIDEPKVYNYALTANQVLLDMNSSSSEVLGALGSNSSYASNSSNQIYCVPGDATSCAAPVGEWNFEEGSGTTVNDSSTNGNTGTWNGSGPTHWVTGKIGGGGGFNGNDDSVTASSNSSLNFGSNQDFTLAAWIKTTQVAAGGNYPVIMNKEVSGPSPARQGYNLYLIGGGNGTISFDTFNNGTQYGAVTSTRTINDGNWHYIEAIREGTTSFLYIDGTYDAQASTTSVDTTNTASLSIGRDIAFTSANKFLGSIDQVRIYNYARSAAQVAWDYNFGKPVGWWKFDECQGTIAHDSSVNGNNGTITIGASGSQTDYGTCTDGNSAHAWANGKNGKYNASLNFDGTDDYVSLGTPTSLEGLQVPVTISAWFYPTSSSGLKPIYAAYQSTSNSQLWSMIRIDNGTLLYYTSTSSGGYQSFGSFSPSLNTWHFVTVTVSGSTASPTVTIYLDGQSQTSSLSALSSTPNTSVPIYIGGDNAVSSERFPGQIDDLRIYNYALTATQVSNLYNQGSAVRFGPVSGNP